MKSKEAKIRVMILVPGIDIGGTERFTCILANHLSRANFDVHLVVTGKPDTIYELREDLDFHHFSINNARNSVFKIREKIIELKPDVVFSTFFYFNLLLAIWRPLFPKNIKFIGRESTVLKFNLEQEKGKIATFIHISLAKIFLTNLDALVCQSQDMYDSLKELGIYHPNVTIINNPIDVKQALEKYKEPISDEYDIVSVGRLSKEKGYDRFLEIVDQYRKKYNPKIRAAIIGEGAEREMIEALIKERGLSQNIFLLGLQTNVFKYYKKAKLFLMTSNYEGY